MKIALAYLVGITVAEVITVTLSPVWGITFHIILLVVVIIYAALYREKIRWQLFLSLSLVPLIRIISLSMPLANIPQVWWYPIIYMPLLVAAFQMMRILGYSYSQIGFNLKKISIQLVVASTGFVIGLAEYFILREEAEVTGAILQETWLLSAFFLIVFTGFVEELIFRGVLQRTAEQSFGWWGVIYVSYLFAIVHVIHNSLLDIVFVFAVALFFGWVVKKTGSIIGVILSHGIANTVLFLVIPLIF